MRALAAAPYTLMTTRFRVPDTLVLLFLIMVLALVATWALPQGSFQTAPNEQGRMMVVPGTYTEHAERVWLSPVSLFTAIPRSLAFAQDIIFFLLIVGGAISVLRATGMIDAVLGRLLQWIGHSPAMLIVFGTGIFAAGSASLGVSTEYIPFALVLVSLCAAMRLDAITAMGVMICGYGVGFGIAWTNPYTVVVAQNIAELPPTSGSLYRFALFLPFVAVTAHHVWRYASRVKADRIRRMELLGSWPDEQRLIVEYTTPRGRPMTLECGVRTSVNQEVLKALVSFHAAGALERASKP